VFLLEKLCVEWGWGEGRGETGEGESKGEIIKGTKLLFLYSWFKTITYLLLNKLPPCCTAVCYLYQRLKQWNCLTLGRQKIFEFFKL
jgi:hypothetical protein